MAIQNQANDMQEMRVKFGGDTHQIEANTFLNTLLPFVSLIQEVSKEIDSSKRVQIKINAEPKPGSFLLDFMIEANNAIDKITGLFSKENVGYVADLIGVIGGVYGAAKFLKGDKPKSIETTTDNSVKIENNSGDVTYIDQRVINIYVKNKAVQHSISKSFDALNADESVTSFELHNKNDEVMVNIPKEDFSDISNIEDAIISTDEKIEPEKAVLNIVGMDWELKKKWDFYYMGHKITAKVKDELFKETIDKGEKFSKGDSLEVEMDIIKSFDEAANTYVNKSYIIKKIIKHIPRGEQFKLFRDHE